MSAHRRLLLVVPLVLAASLGAGRVHEGAAADDGGGGSITLFGPQSFVRTTGPRNVYTTTVEVPAWTAAPFTLHVDNGEEGGGHRVTSAWIEVNGTQVAGPSDFHQNEPGLDRDVTLTPRTTLTVTLASKPGTFLSIRLMGRSGDHTPPVVTVAAPAPGSTINDAAPALLVRYRDTPGAGEAAASGVDTCTLSVKLDGIDRTSLFTRRSEEASAAWPADRPLAEGPHTLTASIRDRAGNTGQATATFRVDRRSPTIAVADPPSGAFLATRTPVLRVRYADETAIDGTSFRAVLNGSDVTALFTVGPAEAVAALDAAHALSTGPQQLTVSIRDLGRNEAVASSPFNVDMRPPTVEIAQPAPAARLGTSSVELVVDYRDDQALDLASFAAEVDGQAVALGVGSEGAIGRVTLADGPHVVTARIRDRAGNLASATASFVVDTAVPEIQILQPPPGALLSTGSPRVRIVYSDAQGVDAATLRVTINGADRRSLFAVGAAEAVGTVPLPDGAVTVVASIADLAGNRASVESSFTLDTVPPTAALEAPFARVRTNRPEVRVRYADQGTGVDPASLVVRVDGVDRTALFARGADGATAVLDPALSEGEHQIEVLLADRAGNAARAVTTFVVDTAAPRGRFLAPLDDAFVNDPAPVLRLAWGDGEGTGVDPATFVLHLRAGDRPETDVTAYMTATAEGAAGRVPPASALTDGTYRLRAELADRAGNVAVVESAFEIDTVAPSYRLERPADDSHVATTTPSIVFRVADARSGVDVGRLGLTVDGVDRSSLLTVDGDRVTAAITEPLSQGRHRIAFRVVDRAGNAAPAAEHVFTVDTIAPAVGISAPGADELVGSATVGIQIAFADEGEHGVDPASVHVTVDGIDQTPRFEVTANGATGTVPLLDGPQGVEASVLDWAGNATTAAARFGVDTTAPVVTLATPAAQSYHRASPVELTGTLRDADPQAQVECRRGERSVNATLSAAQGPVGVVLERTFTCLVALDEGANEVRVVARDRFHREGQSTLALNLDTLAPRLVIGRPLDGEYTAAATVEVSGSAQDASPVTVDVEGVAATVENGAFRATVPLGDVQETTLHVRATDAAGNRAEGSVTVRTDRTPPVLQVTRPTDGARLKGPSVLVEGVVSDAAPVLVEVNGEPAAVTGNSFSTRVLAVDGRLRLTVVARDAAGNQATVERDVELDSVAPTVTVTEPSGDFVTRAAAIRMAGSVADASPVSLVIDGAPVALAEGSFTADVPLPAEGPRTVTLIATDAAGNARTVEVRGTVDRTPPLLEVVSPAAGDVVGALPALVQGTVDDATAVSVLVDGAAAVRTGRAWQASIGGLGEGAHAFEVVATDAAGNATRVLRAGIVDLSPPSVTIATPADGALTREATVEVTGTVTDGTAGTVSVNGGPPAATTPGSSAFTLTVPLSEGDTRLEVTATDSARRPTVAAVTVTRDSTPPTVDLAAPERISRGRGGSLVASATDALGVRGVRVFVNGTLLASFLSPPYHVGLSVPEGVTPGATLTVTAEATDRAGNVTRVSRSVGVVSDGALVGQVLDDRTGLPVAGSRVRLRTPAGERVVTTDEGGHYSLAASELSAVIEIDKDGTTRVVRETPIASGTGTVPVDARLTTLAAAADVGADGGVVAAGPVRLQVPPGALAGPATLQLTLVSAQGLPRLLPLGWSPLAAFDLRLAGAAMSAPLPATLSGMGDGTVHLVTTNDTLGWVVVASRLAVLQGAVTFDVPGPGEYAVVVADESDIVVGAPGEPLGAVEPVALPFDARSTGPVVPAQVPPAGGTAVGELGLESSLPLTSGTVIQAEVTETYRLASSEVASEEKRLEDVVLFRHPAPPSVALAARLPITPSRNFRAEELLEGNVHLEFVSGREGVRGQVGGSEPVDLEAGPVRLRLAAAALAEDTAISVEVQNLSSFLPSAGGLVPLAEAVVDLSGARARIPAELSVTSDVLLPADTVLLCRVVRLDGVPRLTVVAAAALEGGRLVPRALPGLPGVVEGGRYIWYRTPPVGFVSGTTVSGAGVVSAIVSGAGLPFIAVSRADGHFTLPILAGSAVALEAVVPHTSLRGTGAATLSAGETATVDIALAGAASTASVTPPDGAVAQPVSTQVEIVTTTPIDPASVSVQNVRLLRGDPAQGQAVPVRLVLAVSGRRLAVAPEAALAFSTTYTLESAGLVDESGTAVIVPTTTFTTRADTPPVYDTTALTFSFPDENGLVHLTAPPGSLPPGTQVMVLDAGNGMVLTTTARNDGSVEDDIPATINDRMLVTITDPLGNVSTFERSQFVAPDGRVAVGPGGGVIKGDGGIEMRIPDGALDHGVVIKIEPFGPDRFPPEEKPNLPGAHYVGGLTVTSADQPVFQKEAKLAFPVPEGLPSNPADVLFYVYRRLEGPEGRVVFQAIDYATIVGQGPSARVVTASYPWYGGSDSLGTFDPRGVARAVTVTSYYLMWTFNKLFTGGLTPGVVTGKVIRPVLGGSGPGFEAVPGAIISGVDDGGDPLYQRAGTDVVVAISDRNGVYSMWDPNFSGGTVTMKARYNGTERRATAVEIGEDGPDAQLRRLLGLYSHAAKADFTFPAVPVTTPPPSPLKITVYQTLDGRRVDTHGLVATGTPVIVGFQIAGGNVNSASVQAAGDPPLPYAVSPDPVAGPGGFRINADIIVDRIGSYTVTATALTPSGTAVTANLSIRVIGAGAGRDQTLQTEAPRVIGSLTIPPESSTGISLTVLPQVSFTEPVRHVPGAVSLQEAGALSMPIRLSAVGLGGVLIPELTDPDTPVTSVLVEPLVGLKFGTTYYLTLRDFIVDLDTDSTGAPAPKPLVTYETRFETAVPANLSGSDELWGAANIALVGDKAFVVANRGGYGELMAFDTANPDKPKPFADRPAIATGRPADLAVTSDGGLAAVATNPYDLLERPVRLYLFDVSRVGTLPPVPAPAAPPWVGAVTLARSGSDGWARRLIIHGNILYALTFRKGLQIVPLGLVQGLFADPSDAAATARMIRDFNVPGGSFGEEAIQFTVPLEVAGPVGPRAARAFDLRVADFPIPNSPGPLAVLVGEPGLGFATVDTASAVVLRQGPLVHADGTMDWAEALGLSDRNGRRIAIVAGHGTFTTPPLLPTASMLAVVDLEDPATPRVLAMLPLRQTVGDVQIQDNLAFVSAGPGTGSATVIDFTDPEHPAVAGSLTGVGSRMVVDASGLVFSSDRSIGGGDTPLGGVRTAVLGDVALVTKVDPEPILLSAADEVVRDVQLSYRTIPPAPPSGEVTIDVRGGSRVTSLAAAIDDNGEGTTTWPQGTLVASARTYEARLHAMRNGTAMRALPRRLRFDKVPLAITSQDRLLRIQLAMPKQGGPLTATYAVRVYLAQIGQPFPSTPSFEIPSSRIAVAPANTVEWWTGLRATDEFLTRRIDTLDEVPPGTDATIARQAFEIATVLSGYPKVKVVVVSTAPAFAGAELAHKEGNVAVDGRWAEIISRINDQLRSAAGEFVPLEPIPPPPGVFDPANPLHHVAALTVGVLLPLKPLASHPVEMVNGELAGFWAGLKTDGQSIAEIARILADPLSLGKVLSAFVKELAAVFDASNIYAILSTVLQALDLTPPSLTELDALIGPAASYYLGYFAGFATEQVLVGLVATAASAGVAELVKVAAESELGLRFIATLSRIRISALKTLAFFLDEFARLAPTLARLGDKALGLIQASLANLGELWSRYESHELKHLLRTMARAGLYSAEVVASDARWLVFVDRMSEEAAERLLHFIGRDLGEAERWLNRWQSLRLAGTAIHHALEAYEHAGEMSGGELHSLVAASSLGGATAARSYADKYKATPTGDRVRTSLARLKSDISDTRFDDQALAATIEYHARPDVPVASDAAIEGTARLARIPCPRIASLSILASVRVPAGCGHLIPAAVADNYPADVVARFNQALENLALAHDLAADEALARLFWAAHQAGDRDTAAAVIEAASFPTATPRSIAEYLKAIDFMRNGIGQITDGLLDPALPAAPPPFPQPGIHVRRVANLSSGAMAEAWGPVAIRHLIQAGNPNLPRPFTRDDVRSFGAILDIQSITGGSAQSIEADCLLLDGTFFDVKHSLTADPAIQPQQIDLLEQILGDPAGRSLMTHVVFVTNEPVNATLLGMIDAANQRLRTRLGVSEDLIRVIEDVGSFPVP